MHSRRFCGRGLHFEGDYPAWEYKKDSKLREDMVRIFEEMYGKKLQLRLFMPVSSADF